MGYIQDLEKDLQEILNDLERADLEDLEEKHKEIIKYVKEKIIESYRNGITAAKFVKAGKEAERQTRKFKRGR